MISHGVAHKIRDILEAEFKTISLEVIDESEKHRHHKGAEDSDKGNYKVFVTSALFKNKSLIERHRMIYRALDKLSDRIHALAITALAPEEDTNENHKLQ